MKTSEKKRTKRNTNIPATSPANRLFSTNAPTQNREILTENFADEEDDILDTDEDRVMIHHPGEVTEEERHLLWQSSESMSTPDDLNL